MSCLKVYAERNGERKACRSAWAILDVPAHPGGHVKEFVINLDPIERPTLSIDEASVVLGIARASAYQAAQRGEIPVVRFGRRLRVPTAALRRMLDLDDEPQRTA
jgi:excisionase family DNA binding protein